LLKKLLTLFFICLVKLIVILIKIFYRFGGRFILLWLYRLYSFLKQEFKRGLAPLQNKLYYYLGNRHLIHFIIIALAIFVAVSNIKAHDNRNADLLAIEKESLISRLVPKSPEEIESFELIEEEMVIDSKSPKRVCRYLDIEGVAKAEPQLVDKTEEAEDWTKISLKEDTLLKPQIVTTAPEDYYPYIRTSIESYVVKSGDTLSSIAKKFSVSVETILWENNLSIYSTLQPSQKLAILPTSGLTYKIKKGDTVEKIAKNFKVDSDKILAYNNLTEVSGLKVGEIIVVPDGKKIIIQPKSLSPLGAIKQYYEAPTPRSVLGFIWPTTCRRITQYYSWRHHAIDIACGYNVPIYAVESGVVESACWVGGYGKRIIIRHTNGMRTLYGHFNQLNVSTGQTVKKGQVIGLMGSTGRSTGAHVHFEVMAGSAKQNPLRYY
jgi:murein DD-endopeptidase MepM/ murein hydrolase activator NlpD